MSAAKRRLEVGAPAGSDHLRRSACRGIPVSTRRRSLAARTLKWLAALPDRLFVAQVVMALPG